MANHKKTEAVEPISVTTEAAPVAPSADETASQLIGILTKATPELQAQIIKTLSQTSGYNPMAVGQEKHPNKKKQANPSSVVAAFGSAQHADPNFEPIPPSSVTDKDGDPSGKGPHAQAWLQKWHEGNAVSSRQMTLEGMSYSNVEEIAAAAQMEYPTEGIGE